MDTGTSNLSEMSNKGFFKTIIFEKIKKNQMFECRSSRVLEYIH